MSRKTRSDNATASSRAQAATQGTAQGAEAEDPAQGANAQAAQANANAQVVVPGANAPGPNAQGANAQGAGGAQVAIFTLRPSIDGILDFSDKRHLKLREQGAAAVYDKYDLSPEKLQGFLAAMICRAMKMGWTNPNRILLIPDLSIPTAPSTNLLTEHGTVSLGRVKTYILRDVNGKNSREAQDDVTIADCLEASLSPDAFTQIFNRYSEWMIRGTASGTILLKIILEESNLTVQATIMKHKKELVNLTSTMTSLKFNVEHFNQEVARILATLRNHGETAPDLIHQLFPAYESCPDKTFNGYITNLRHTFEDNGQLRALELMKKSCNRYKSLVDSDTWSTRDEQESILALKAEMQTLKKAFRANKGSRPREGKYKAPHERNNQNRAWMTTPPKDGGSNERTITTKSGVAKKYYFCSAKSGAPKGAGCDKWVRHNPKTCDPKVKKAQAAKAKKASAYPARSKDIVVDNTEIASPIINMEFDLEDTDEDVKSALESLAVMDDSEE